MKFAICRTSDPSWKQPPEPIPGCEAIDKGGRWPEWYIEIRDLAHLVELSSAAEPWIVAGDCVEIYDDYRE